MITVYGAAPSRALRVLWMLEEMGLEYQVHQIDFANRFDDADFIAASPPGFMPGFKDGDVRMMESVAIIDYLSRRYGPTPLAVREDEPGFPAYLQFLHFGEASIAGPLNVTMGSRFFAPEDQKQNWGATFAVDMVAQRANAVADVLKRSEYVAANRFTAADISLGYALGLAEPFGFADRLDPALTDYVARLKQRPAYQRASAHRV